MMKTALLVAVAALAIARPIGVWAEVPDPDKFTVGVGPQVTGPTVSQGSAGYDRSGIQSTANSITGIPGSSPQGGEGSGYQYRPIPYGAVMGPGGYYLRDSGVISITQGGWRSACPSGQTGYYVYDPAGAAVGVVCVGTSTPTVSTPAEQLAQQASSQQPWPNLTLSINPGTGLTGLASWFWLGGGSGTMPDATASAGPLTVTVRATVTDVLWDFGDGSRADSGTSLGQAYPARSDVQHIYQTDSYGLPQGFSATASLVFAVRYSVNGGPWLGLGTKVRPYTRQYVVNQLQPQAVR